jgi:transcriptional regulator with XRE-family HTH domain
MRTLDEIVSGLPAERREKIAARTRQLIAEETALRHLRQARELTQQSMAKLLEVDQGTISKIENRSDMLLSTLRSYVEAMGGALRLVAEFPDGVAEITSLSADLDAPPLPKSRKEPKASRRPHLIHASD